MKNLWICFSFFPPPPVPSIFLPFPTSWEGFAFNQHVFPAFPPSVLKYENKKHFRLKSFKGADSGLPPTRSHWPVHLVCLICPVLHMWKWGCRKNTPVSHTRVWERHLSAERHWDSLIWLVNLTFLYAAQENLVLLVSPCFIFLREIKVWEFLPRLSALIISIRSQASCSLAHSSTFCLGLKRPISHNTKEQRRLWALLRLRQHGATAQPFIKQRSKGVQMCRNVSLRRELVAR